MYCDNLPIIRHSLQLLSTVLTTGLARSSLNKKFGNRVLPEITLPYPMIICVNQENLSFWRNPIVVSTALETRDNLNPHMNICLNY